VSAFAVVCHPHPLYGGSMDNKVVYTLARTLEQLGHLPSASISACGRE